MTRTPDTRPSASPRPRKVLWRLLVVLAILSALFALRLGVGMLVAWVHYATTPGFEEYVRDTPVAKDVVEARLAGGEPLVEGERWWTGTVDPFAAEGADSGGRSFWQTRFEWSSRHADRRLASIVAEVALTSPDGLERDGYGVRLVSLEVDEALHCAVKLHVVDPELVVGAGSKSKGQVLFDVLLVAGPGASTVEVVRGAPTVELPAVESEPSLWRLVAGLVSPVGDPAPEGWWQQVRQGVFTTQWSSDGRSQGAGFSPLLFCESTSLYSNHTEYAVRSLENGGESLARTGVQDRNWTWSGTIY